MNKEKGFTLIELLVVIAIIGILAVVILAALGQARKAAKDAKLKEGVSNVMTAVETYASIEGDYPTTSTDLIPNYVVKMPEGVTLSSGGEDYCIVSEEFAAKSGVRFYAQQGVSGECGTGTDTACPC